MFLQFLFRFSSRNILIKFISLNFISKALTLLSIFLTNFLIFIKRSQASMLAVQGYNMIWRKYFYKEEIPNGLFLFILSST